MMIDENDLLAVADYDTFMRQDGYYVGYHGCSLIKNIVDEFKGKLGDNLSKAKGLFVLFNLNDDIPLTILDKILNEIESLIDGDIDIWFETITDNSISVDSMEYMFLLSGVNYAEGE